MKLDSPFYVIRPADGQFNAALSRFENIVCLRGPRQVGKTSLLARGLARAREAGARVVVTDFQHLSEAETACEESFYSAIAHRFAAQLKTAPPDFSLSPFPTPGIAFEAFLEQQVIRASPCRVVWAIDEADGLFSHSYATNVFSAIRARFNAISLMPDEPWRNLATILTYSTEAHLFIANLNVSPFNVGDRIELSDFTQADIESLNERYGRPLDGPEAIRRLHDLVGGHPYLTRYALHEMKARGVGIGAIESFSSDSARFFGDHLHRLSIALQADSCLVAAIRSIVRGETCVDEPALDRLRMAGVLIGSRTAGFTFRCKLYETFLMRFAA